LAIAERTGTGEALPLPTSTARLRA